MMTDSSVSETCACGAKFRYVGASPMAAAREWRKDHRHEMPAEIKPGLCGASSGIIWPNGRSPYCELRAGHAGMHECNRGSMGGTAVWSDETTQALAERHNADHTGTDHEAGHVDTRLGFTGPILDASPGLRRVQPGEPIITHEQILAARERQRHESEGDA